MGFKSRLDLGLAQAWQVTIFLLSAAPLVGWWGSVGFEESVRFEVVTSLASHHFPLVGRSAWVRGFFCETP